MKVLLKKHLGLIICILCLVAFPNGLGVQARLNMRMIVTGLAIDFDGENYEVTAQYVKTANGGSGTSGAEVSFVSESDKTIKSAISKLVYKSGKGAAFSHTNFVILGQELAKDKALVCLDYFVRNKIIDSSAMVLVSSSKAGDDIKKTKDLELSVAASMQKVFVFKQMESDAVMTTVIEFLKWSRTDSGAVAVSEIVFDEEDKNKSETTGSGEDQSGGGQTASEGESQNKSGVFFKPKAPIDCFSDGNFVFRFEDEDEIDGFLLLRPQSTRGDILVENLEPERLADAKVGVKIKDKHEKMNVRYEGEIPVLDVTVSIVNSEIFEIAGKNLIQEISNEEFDAIKDGIKKEIMRKITKTFEKSKNEKVDIFGAYDKAQKFHYKDTNKYYSSVEKFIEKLKLNIKVNVDRLEY